MELAGAEPADNSPGVQLLASIQMIFQQKNTDRLSSQTLVRALLETEDGPVWTNRAPFTKVHLARLLAPFGIRPTLVHRSRARVSRGYFARDFADAFARYLPNRPIS